MTLSIYRPTSVFDTLDRLFDAERPYLRPYRIEAYALPVDVRAEADEYLITASAPGLKSDDLSVEVLADTVTIQGEVAVPETNDEANWLLRERRYGKFARTLTFPVELDCAKAEASVENGVLTLRVPKAETARPKMIKVKAK